MTGILYLALQHLRYYRLRSLTFVFVMATLITIPMLGRLLTDAAEMRMMARAESTPLVYGATGSSLDLVLASAYFRGDAETPIMMEDFSWLLSMRMAQVAPIHRAGTSAKHPIVGTDIEYLSMRKLRVEKGRKPVWIGEVLLGSGVAADLNLNVGDEILSDTEQAFDLAGTYPVGMTVSGILARSNTPDDMVILTDLKTSWIVAGLGHGHADLTNASPGVILRKSSGSVTANASLPTYVRIDQQNLESFHSHSSTDTSPLTAILVFPNDAKAAALIRGRVADNKSERQIVRPVKPISGLLEDVFAVKTILDRVILVLSTAALFALGLVVSLSVQMRRREFDIARRLGGRFALPAWLVLGELSLLSLAALAISAVILSLVLGIGTDAIDGWLMGEAA